MEKVHILLEMVQVGVILIYYMVVIIVVLMVIGKLALMEGLKLDLKI